VIPKLKSFVPKFSLWDRKFVERRKLAPKAPSKDKAAQQAKASATPSPTATPKPKLQAAAKKTPTPTHTPGLVVDGNSSPTANEVGDPAESNPFGGIANQYRSPNPEESPSPETQIGEWRMRILRSPTKSTMNEFVLAFQTGQVTKTVFYQVIEELMRDSSPEVQRLSVYGLAATPSFDSLRLLLVHKDDLSGEAGPMLKVALEAYAKPDKLALLGSALRSENTPLVLGAMPLVVKTSKKVRLWSTEQSSLSGDRDRRGPSTGVPKGGFIEIVKTLRDLEDSSDRLIAQAARDTLGQLAMSNATARRRD
jgi:hypothetical protein